MRLDEDLPLGAVLTADGRAERVVGPAEPCAVPARFQHGHFHLCNCGLSRRSFCVQRQMAKNIGVGPAVFDEHPGDEHGLRDRAFAGAGDLEALAGVGGEAVEIQTVVPVGAADKGSLCGPRCVQVNRKLRRRCSMSGAALSGSQSNVTLSSKIDQSPVSRK